MTDSNQRSTHFQIFETQRYLVNDIEFFTDILFLFFRLESISNH